jgi:hypothetical protein
MGPQARHSRASRRARLTSTILLAAAALIAGPVKAADQFITIGAVGSGGGSALPLFPAP